MQSRMFMAVTCAWLFSLTSILFDSNTLADSTRPQENPVYARINDKVITLNEFLQIFSNAVKNKFYHGSVPQAELAAFQRKVSKDIINQVLLHQEAKKLGIKPDLDKIKAGLKEYDDRYAKIPGWKPRTEAEQELMLYRLSQKDILDQMEARVKSIKVPGENEIRKYYLEHPEKFTEPRRLGVSVILLPVPPSSLSDSWIEAEKVAETLIDRIKKGEQFADLAKEYSSHASAVNGGDLGYLHQDMLDPAAQTAVDKLKLNEITPPVRVLKGVTLFRLNGVREAKLNSFEDVAARAGDLLYRDLQEKAWDDYLASLSQSADIFVNEKILASEDVQ